MRLIVSNAKMDPTNRPSSDTAGASFGLFVDWALRSPTSYSLAILLLFTLGLLGRFLGTVKWQLERSWNLAQNTNSARENYIDLHPDDNDGESQPLSPDDSFLPLEKRRYMRKFWAVDKARNVRQDGIRALLEFARAVIAYTL
jgi:hypothetical protein